MNDFEQIFLGLLIPLYGIAFYLAGKGNLFELVPLMLQKRLKETTKVVHKEWIVEKDTTSASYRCPVCSFELTLADPEEKLEYKGCPMCLSMLKEGAE